MSPRNMCTRIAVATPTPTTIRKRLRVVLTTNLGNTCELDERTNLFPSIDGYYAINSLQPEKWNTLKLREYFQIAKELYQLSDCDALQLLGFFKNNLAEACRHLYIDGTQSTLHLDFDSPWRLSSKSISELSCMEHFTTHTFFKSFHQLFIVNSNILTNVLPQQPLAEQFPGRYLRIQRTFHRGHVIWAGCVLPNENAPIEVAALLLPCSEQSELNHYTELMEELERYLGPLVLASKSWSPKEQKPMHQSVLIQVLSALTASVEGLLKNELLTNQIPRDAVSAVLSSFELLY